MGFTLDTFGKPVFNPTPQTVLDLQAGADFAREFANIRVGTAANRGTLAAAKAPNGMLFIETDTGRVFKRISGAWVDIAKTASGRMVRSATAASPTNAAYFDASLNTYWTASEAFGGVAYANGWRVPWAGRWLVSLDVRFGTAQNMLGGFAVNQPSVPSPTLQGVQTVGHVQSVSALSMTKVLNLAANDVVEPYFLAATTAAPWTVSIGEFRIDWLGD